MKIKTGNVSAFLVIFMALSGCASISPQKELEDIQSDMKRRTQKRPGIDFAPRDEAAVATEVTALLRDPLSPDAAVEIALLNNPALQADFAELGVIKADLVRAGLLKNPSLHGFIREPNHTGETNREFEIKQDVLSLLTLPLQKRISGLRLEGAGYSLGEAILHLENEVRTAFYTLQAARQMAALQEKIFQGQEAAAELAERQFEAGNVNDIAVAGHRLVLHQAQTDLKQKEADLHEAREALGRLLGLTTRDTSWDIQGSLPFVSQKEPRLEELEAKAISQNFNLLMARQQIKVMDNAVKVSRVNALPEIQAGFNTEKEADGGRLAGPIFSVEVPLFDQKQSAVARSKAQLEQARALLKAKEDEVVSEVRSKYSRLLAVRSMAETYLASMLPLHAKLTESLQRHYNFMLVGVYDLLNAKKEEAGAYHQFLEILKEYWILRSELELLTGEKLKYVPADASAMESAFQAPAPEHHRHGQEVDNEE